MARIRTIKPQFFLNDEIASLTPLDRILFIGLWTLADRAGRLEDRPTRIKVQILPYDDHDIDIALTRLTEKKFIVRYEVQGERLIEIINFIKHQHCHVKEPESTIPAPGKNGAKPVRKRQEGKGREQEGKGTIQAGQPPAFTLPDWIPKATWESYEEMRREKKKVPTDRARELVVKELVKLKSSGNDPVKCLEQSIRNGWTDVYADKENKNARSQNGGSGGVVRNFAEERQRQRDERNARLRNGSFNVPGNLHGEESKRPRGDIVDGEACEVPTVEAPEAV